MIAIVRALIVVILADMIASDCCIPPYDARLLADGIVGCFWRINP